VLRTGDLTVDTGMRYDDDMAKRDTYYEGLDTTSPYPRPNEAIRKLCDICGLWIIVNNWPDGKSRTPMIKGFVVCASCDPRHPEDAYMKTGYRILQPRRMRAIRFAQIARAMSKHGCLRQLDPEQGDCKCAGCASMRLFPTTPAPYPSQDVIYGG